jgi:hypothetical protein
VNVPIIKPKHSNIFKISIDETAEEVRRYRVTRTIDVEIEVPESVIEEALEDHDSDYIFDWIVANYRNGTASEGAIDRELVNEETVEEYSYHGVSDSELFRKKWDEISGERDE